MYYFDYSATTRPYDEVIAVMSKVMGSVFGNPSSLHGLGVEAERLLSQGRENAATLLGVTAKEIIFTSGGSESNNLALKGIAHEYKKRGRHLITSAVEHAAVFEVMQQLAADGFDITVLPVDKGGQVRVEDVRQALRDDTILVSIMHVNNELGTIQPIEAIGHLLRKYPKVYFHVDGVQGWGKVPLSIKSCGIDLYSLSAHKFHGPRGAGILYKRDGIQLQPVITGGGQEKGLRAGTENVPAIVGMVKAMRLTSEKQTAMPDHLQQLKSMFLAGMQDFSFPFILNSPVSGAPHIVHLSFPGLRGEVLVHALEEKQVYVSTRSACSSKADKISRVLEATGMDLAAAKGSLRISFSYGTTKDEVDYLLRILKDTVHTLSGVMAGGGR